MMITIFHGLALALYVVAEGILALSLAGGRSAVPWGGSAVMGAAFLLHGAGLAAYVAAFGELPLVGLAPSLSTLAFLIGAVLFIVALLREGRPVGLVLMPVVVLLLAVSLVVGLRPAGEPLAFRGIWFSLHVVLAFAGYAGLAVAFAAGLLYLLQFRELKSKHFGRMFRFFPSLATLDALGRRSLAGGFSALSAALVLGWAWTARFTHSMEAQDPKVVWAVFTWLIFLAALGARAGGGGRDRRGAMASVVAFLLVVLSFIVLRLALSEGRQFL
jgi:HemX protein